MEGLGSATLAMEDIRAMDVKNLQPGFAQSDSDAESAYLQAWLNSERPWGTWTAVDPATAMVENAGTATSAASRQQFEAAQCATSPVATVYSPSTMDETPGSPRQPPRPRHRSAA